MTTPVVADAASSTRSIPRSLPGQQRRRHRRPARHRCSGSTICDGSASTRSGSRRSFPRRWPTSATTSPTTADIDPLFGTLDDFDALAATRARARPEADPRLRAEPHLGPASVVPSRAAHARDNPEARLVHLARPRRRRRAAQQLAERSFGGTAWKFDDGHRPVLLPRLPAASSRTSTGATRRCRRRCSTCCASGCDRGVDGFRVDVIWHLIKDEEFRDNPPNPACSAGRSAVSRRLTATYTSDQAGGARRSSPRCARVIDEYPASAC